MTLPGKSQKTEIVPVAHPYGGITDGTWVCSRCGESITGCMLCAGEAVSLVKAPPAPESQWGNWRK
jgi:hypothetical protein